MTDTPAMPQFVADHIQQYFDDPEAAHMWDASAVGGTGILPCLLLVSRDHKTGEEQPRPLIYGEVDGAYVVVGSKGGSPTHPGWYYNLLAEPNCRIHVGAQQFAAKARLAEGDERAAKWDAMVEVYPGYAEYVAKAEGREIPVVVLEV
jgi:F420H(2)-dependent quinone reductase